MIIGNISKLAHSAACASKRGRRQVAIAGLLTLMTLTPATATAQNPFDISAWLRDAAVTAVVAASAPQVAAPQSTAPQVSAQPKVLAGQYSAEVIKIIDGDTAKVRFGASSEIQTLRFAYIDTPESKSSKKQKRDSQKCEVSTWEMSWVGKKATNALKNLQKQMKDQPVSITINAAPGKYGRQIGTLYFGDIDVNKWLVESGYACAYRDHPKMNTIEYQAHATNQGLWESDHEIMHSLCHAK